MSTALDMSLDDIIDQNKRNGGQSCNFRGNRRGSVSGPERRFLNRAPARATPYSNLPPMQMQRQIWQQQQLLMSGGRGILQQQQVFGSGAETRTKLYISDLDYGVSNEDIKVLFSEVGKMNSYSIHYDKSGRSKGTAEVEFLRSTDAVAAIKKYNNVELDGKPMKIELVGVNLVTTTVVSSTSNGILRNPIGNFRRVNEQGRGQAIGRASYRGRGIQGVTSHGVERGRGQSIGEKKSAEDLDAELVKYHLEAMQRS